MSPDNLKSGDNDELEALFDEIADQKLWDHDAPAEPVQPVQAQAVIEPEVHAHVVDDTVLKPGDHNIADDNEEPHDVFVRLGQLTRKLHDALRELGYDKNVESAVNSLPDARARLNYIASLTGKAAEKVLSSVETCQVINDTMSDKARALDDKWQKLYNNELTLEEFKSLSAENHQFVKDIALQSQSMGANLTEIMMAQDFHDLTGQVVNRIASMAQNLETQLVQLLLDTTPPERRNGVEEQWLSGPAMNAEGRSDVCSNQGQVDDLLESLGF